MHAWVVCAWFCFIQSRKKISIFSLEKYTWDISPLPKPSGSLGPIVLFVLMGKLRLRGLAIPYQLAPDSETPSELEVEPTKGLVTAREETGLGRELGWSPTILGDP